MEQTAESVNREAQRICSLFHYGWISKKEVGPIERNLELYQDVEAYLAHTGYELINPPGTEWYIIRLKKEFDTNAFDDFLKRASGINKTIWRCLSFSMPSWFFPRNFSMWIPRPD